MKIHPKSFSFVVFEGPNYLLDWGTKSFRRGINAVKIPAKDKMNALFHELTPSAIVAKRLAIGEGSNQTNLLALIEAGASSQRIPIRFVSAREIDRALLSHAKKNKHALAAALATRFPTLAAKLPPKRKCWQSEDYRMGMFDAAAVGVAYYARCATREIDVSKSDKLIERAGAAQTRDG